MNCGDLVKGQVSKQRQCVNGFECEGENTKCSRKCEERYGKIININIRTFFNGSFRFLVA